MPAFRSGIYWGLIPNPRISCPMLLECEDGPAPSAARGHRRHDRPAGQQGSSFLEGGCDGSGHANGSGQAGPDQAGSRNDARDELIAHGSTLPGWWDQATRKFRTRCVRDDCHPAPAGCRGLPHGHRLGVVGHKKLSSCVGDEGDCVGSDAGQMATNHLILKESQCVLIRADVLPAPQRHRWPESHVHASGWLQLPMLHPRHGDPGECDEVGHPASV